MTRTERLILVVLAVFLALGAALRWRLRARPPALEVAAGMAPPRRIHVPGHPSSGVLDLNRASAAELEALPGIGPGLAAAIVRRRDRRGPFRDASEVLEIRGFGAARYSQLRSTLSVDGRTGAPASKKSRRTLPEGALDLNRARAEELSRLPFLGQKTAERIVRYRREKGPFRDKSDLLRIPDFPIALYRKISPFLSCAGTP
jgi:competence ComEA-like helix-hairpin-helix protein